MGGCRELIRPERDKGGGEKGDERKNEKKVEKREREQVLIEGGRKRTERGRKREDGEKQSRS